MESEKYLIITSNSEVVAGNSSSHFTNRLSKPLDLSEGNWKVGVKKLMYLNSFLTIIDEFLEIPRKLYEVVFTHNSKNPEMVESMADKTNNISITWNDEAESTPITIIINAEDELPKYHYKSFEIVYIPADGRDEFIIFTQPVSEQAHKMEQSFRIHYEKSWGEGKVRIVVHRRDKFEKIFITRGHYDSIKQLIKTMNQLTKKKLTWTVNEDGYVNVTLMKPTSSVRMAKNLNLILGFKSDTLPISSSWSEKHNVSPFIASMKPQLNRGRFAFFIYTNIIESTHVGDLQVPLLDIISIAPKAHYGEVVSMDVVNPIYQPISMKQINEIEIQMVSDSGEQIIFDNSTGDAKTILVLHLIRT